MADKKTNPKDIIYVIGHKSPTIDSVGAAIAYAHLKNISEKTERYIPAVAGKINRETKYILEKFWFNTPMLLEDAKGKNIIMVDHNEFTQAVDNIEQSNIIEVIDHHKIEFSYPKPLYFYVVPLGSTCSLVAQMMINSSVDMDKNMAGLLLSGILTDTILLKSPTTTEHDQQIVDQLTQMTGMDNWQVHGLDIFRIRSKVNQLAAKDIIRDDYRIFKFKAGVFYIGQVETVNLEEFIGREEELIKALGDLKKEKNYHTAMLLVTDIVREGSQFLVISDDQNGVEEALGVKFRDNKTYIYGCFSRKKQVAPKLMEVFSR